MMKQYKEIIRVICDDYLPKRKKFALKADIELIASKYDASSEAKNVNFDPLIVDTDEQDILINLITSIKNIRKDISIDGASKRVLGIANEMKRASFICDMEYKYVLALNYSNYPIHEHSAYFHVIIEYIREYYDKFDVINDIRPYIQLFGPEESKAIKLFARGKVDNCEESYDPVGDSPPIMKLIRWRVIHFKINKLLGSFVNLDKPEKLKLVNTIVQTYLWASGKDVIEGETDRSKLTQE